MFRFVIAACIALLCATATARAGTLAGSWECTAVSTQVTHWTLDVHEAKNKLSGSVTDGVAVFQLLEPKTDGDLFTFKLTIEGNLYAVELKISSGKLEGKYTGPEANGTLNCKRQ
jgi:hypothetical protein